MTAVPLELHEHVRAPAHGEGDGLLVLLHGRGADEHDLIPLGDALDPGGRLWVATPRGPLSLPPGGSHWYVVPRVGHPDPTTFHASLRALEAWLVGLAERVGVGPERTVIGGFSQGSVMSYALALGAGRPVPAGLMVLSGFVPSVEGWAPALGERPGLPVAIAHGTVDPVIGVEFARQARALLRQGGIEPLYREFPMGHGIDPHVVHELRAWVAAAL